MVEQKYVLNLQGTDSFGKVVDLDSVSIGKQLKDLRPFKVSIMGAKINRTIAFVRFESKETFTKGSIPEFSLSGESFNLAKDFFKAFKQSSFHLVFFPLFLF